jgi:hypothetical protein
MPDKKKPAPKASEKDSSKKKKPDLKVRELTEDELVGVAGGMRAREEEPKSRQSVCKSC